MMWWRGNASRIMATDKENPTVTSQTASDVEHWYCLREQAVDQTVDTQVIWNAFTLMWCYTNRKCPITRTALLWCQFTLGQVQWQCSCWAWVQISWPRADREACHLTTSFITRIRQIRFLTATISPCVTHRRRWTRISKTINFHSSIHSPLPFFLCYSLVSSLVHPVVRTFSVLHLQLLSFLPSFLPSFLHSFIH